MSSPMAEFCEANAGPINALLVNAKHVIDTAIDRVTVEVVPDQETTILEGRYTPEDFLALHDELPIDVALEVGNETAHVRNRAIEHHARIKMINLNALASANHFVGLYDKGLSAPENLEEYKRLLTYEQGLYRAVGRVIVGGAGTLEVEQTELGGLEHYDTAREFSVQATDELGVARILSVNVLDDKVVSVGSHIALDTDPLIRRCAEILGTGVADVFSIIASNYESDEQLDEELAQLWLRYQGTSIEQEAGPLLDEVRDRAVAQRESHVLGMQHGTGLPSVEQLEEFAHLLAA